MIPFQARWSAVERAARHVVDAGGSAEQTMILNRLVLGVLVLVAAGVQASGGARPAQDFWREGLPWLRLYLLAVAAFHLHVRLWPTPNCARRIAAICVDASVITFGLQQGDAASAYLFPFYFWMILANGVRLGARYMGAAVAACALGFAHTAWRTSFWNSHVALSAGLFASLIIIPIYGGLLLRRLAEAHAEAERANHAKTLLLACVSHELRTPLTAIIGLGALLQKTALDGQQREMARTLSSAGDLLLHHIEGLLTVARDEIVAEPERRERVDLFALLVSLRRLLAVEADKKGLRLGLCIDAEAPRHVLVDPALLLDVLQNLVGNAVKFTERGAVAIHLGIGRRESDAIELKFEVGDTGPGIAQAAQARIFESFVQADPGVSRRFGGSGLGLAIARRRLDARGGRIGVESAPGKGARFRFELTAGPVDPSAEDAPRAAACEILDIPDDGWTEFDGPQASEPACVSAPCESLALARRFSIAVVARDGAEARARGVAARLREIAAAPGGEATAEREGAQGPLKILLAEDNGVNRMVLEKILVQAGHATWTVGDGEAALDILRQEPFDVILLDVNMPGVDGPEVARLYRRMPLRAHAPILALTADASEACRQDCAQAGMAACLTKPLSPERLLAAIAEAFATARRDGRAPAEPATPDDAEPLDRRALAALRKLGGADFVRRLATQFLEEGQEILERIAAAVETGDLPAFRRESHALASAAGNVGAAGLARLCRSWTELPSERFARGGGDLLDGLRAEWARVARAARSLPAGRESRRGDAAA